MPILGLLGTEALASERFTNIRREVFYQYPNGAAPLTGLLTMLDEEETNDPEFTWYEKRMPTQYTETASQGSSKGPILTSVGADAGDPVTLVAASEYRLCVDDASIFRTGHLIRMVLDEGTSGTLEIIGRVTSANASSSPQYVQFVALNGGAVKNGTTNENVDKGVWVTGSAFAQGAVGSSGDIYKVPTPISNYCQIMRAHFTITGTALKTALKYDETGPYADQAKDALYQHSIEMEKNLLFGRKTKTVDPVTNLPLYTFGGLIWFLEQWEAGSVYGNVAATLNTDDTKRIINVNGNLNEATYDTYLERCFRFTNNVSNEKLALCGSGFLKTVNQMYKSASVLQAQYGTSGQTYGMDIVSHLTPFGVLHYKTHPLLSENAEWRNSAIIIDVRNLKYRYLSGRDTELLKNRQPNDADYRKDEWLTEAGFEVRFPESHMVIKNVTGYSA